MAERVPPPPVYANQCHGSQLQLPNFGHGTYVVQVPRDQVYRVPSTENAHIAEHHRYSLEREQKRSRCWFYVRIITYIAIVIVIGGVLGGFFFMLNKSKDPRFSIQHFLFHNALYNINLKVHNPNSRMGISYKGGNVSLLVRQREIASGAYPSFFQDHHNSTVLRLDLKGSKDKLPKVVDESMRNGRRKVHVTFSLSIHVSARTKMWKLHGRTKKHDVTCQVTVDTLAKATHVLSQQCKTK